MKGIAQGGNPTTEGPFDPQDALRCAGAFGRCRATGPMWLGAQRRLLGAQSSAHLQLLASPHNLLLPLRCAGWHSDAFEVLGPRFAHGGALRNTRLGAVDRSCAASHTKWCADRFEVIGLWGNRWTRRQLLGGEEAVLEERARVGKLRICCLGSDEMC